MPAPQVTYNQDQHIQNGLPRAVKPEPDLTPSSVPFYTSGEAPGGGPYGTPSGREVKVELPEVMSKGDPDFGKDEYGLDGDISWLGSVDLDAAVKHEVKSEDEGGRYQSKSRSIASALILQSIRRQM